MRDKAEKLRNDLLFPKSPAFVNNFRNVKKDVELTQLAQHAHSRNIPFNSEEQNFYRSRQCKQRFK